MIVRRKQTEHHPRNTSSGNLERININEREKKDEDCESITSDGLQTAFQVGYDGTTDETVS